MVHKNNKNTKNTFTGILGIRLTYLDCVLCLSDLDVVKDILEDILLV